MRNNESLNNSYCRKEELGKIFQDCPNISIACLLGRKEPTDSKQNRLALS